MSYEDPNSARSLALDKLSEEVREKYGVMTLAEVEFDVEQAIDDHRYDCPNGGDGPDD